METMRSPQSHRAFIRTATMIKTAYFMSRDFKAWPPPQEIERYFLGPPGERWFETGNDTAGFDADGVDGTEHIEPDQLRHNVSLDLSAHRTMGVFLQWRKWHGDHQELYLSRGDLGRLRQIVRNSYGDPLSAGLLIPCEEAWKAVKEFIETDGLLPKSIAWVAGDDLPSDLFADPWDSPS